VFTPVNEIPFAGHPTLGTAYIVRHEIMSELSTSVTLNMKVGQIFVRFDDDGTAWMQQAEPKFQETYEPQVVADVLGIDIEDIDTRFPIQAVSTGLPHIMTPLKTLSAVKRAYCNIEKFKQMVNWETEKAIKGLFVFAPEAVKEENDFHSRGFVELITGMVEDPATGSANGCFAAWLAHHRYFGTNTISARVEQGYAIDRPSLLLLSAEDKGESVSVQVGGRVNLVAKGEII
jgi:trans-2,3-dihydro-3-hydroxyanthranilate isomerase